MRGGSGPARSLVIGLVATCIGCPGNLDDPGRFADAAISDAGPGSDLPAEAGLPVLPVDAGDCPDVAQSIFGPTCATSGCHSAQDKTQGLDLQSPDLFARLAGVQANEGPGLLVDRGSPSQSVLYTKLTPTPPFGARMPLVGAPLSDADIACVLSWIESSTK